MRLKGTALAMGAAVTLVVGPLGAAASAHEHGGPPPLHGHIKLIGLQFDQQGEPFGFRKCIHLPSGNALPLKAHHAHLHTGRAGEAQWNAGHAVVPLAPLSPWSSCADFCRALEAGELD